jgi:hypothetical protein
MTPSIETLYDEWKGGGGEMLCGICAKRDL